MHVSSIEWKDREDVVTFESHAYEALLTTINSLELQTYKAIKEKIDNLLLIFQSGSILPVKQQEKMKILQNNILTMRSKVLSDKKVLLELLDDDESMALMNLTKIQANPQLFKLPLSMDALISHEIIEVSCICFYSSDYNILMKGTT